MADILESNNPNFIFLKNKFPEIYENCTLIDFLISQKIYNSAVSQSRITIEKIINDTLDKKSRKKEMKLREKIEVLSNYSHISDTTKKNLDYIRVRGNFAVHDERQFNKIEANVIAKKVHEIVKDIYESKSGVTSRIPDYQEISGNEEWIQKQNPAKTIAVVEEKIKNLYQSHFKEFEEELDDIKKEFNSLLNDLLSKNKNLSEDIENFKNIMENFPIFQVEDNASKIIQLEKTLKAVNNQLNSKKIVSKEEFDYLSNVVSNLLNDKNLNTKKDNRFADENQKRAIESDSKKLIIDAGPGAGKTYVIIKRIEYLVKNRNIPPESLLVITFTNKAANELKNRLKDGELKTSQIDQIEISTIHSFCKTFLRDYCSSGIKINDDEDDEHKKLFFVKHREELGFTGYSYIPDDELYKVINTFDEYSTFNVDYEEAANHIKDRKFKNKRRIKKNKKYEDFIDSFNNESNEFNFPLKEIRKNKQMSKIWENYKNLAIAEAYPKYMNLLKENRAYDFNLLQFEALEKLKDKKNSIRFKNILVDEFQDIDSTQMEIINELMEISDSITLVGDADQSIYGWRGSNPDYFNNLLKDESFEKVFLSTNYRSPENIVDLTESFIASKRENPKELSANKKEKGDLYYLNSTDKEDEARKIVKIISHLKNNNKIENLSDICLLFRSTNYLNTLLDLLDENGISYSIKGANDFNRYSEVKAVLTLLWYLTESMEEFEDISLDNFADDKLNNEMFNLTKSTRELISNIDNPLEFSQMEKDDLIKIGIDNENDLEFFNNLNNLKKQFYKEKESNKLTLLDLYYKLFEITDYIKDKFENIPDYEVDENVELLNLGLISNKIDLFMDNFDRYDLDTFVKQFYVNYSDLSSPKNNLKEDNIQIMTVHKAKGLEFPVVFVCSLDGYSFPKNKFQNSQTPLKLKMQDIEKERKKEEESIDKYFLEKALAEEDRIVYVGLTRAISTLFVSQIKSGANKNFKLINQLKQLNPGFEELTMDNLDILSKVKSKGLYDDKELNLSFTSLEDYEECPRKYNLIYNYKFLSPQNEYMYIGSICHDVLNIINTQAINNEVDDDFLDDVIEEAMDYTKLISNDEKLIDSLDGIEGYWDDYGSEWNILHSEYPFTINRPNFNFIGQIDLIMEKGNILGIVDFKTADSVFNEDKYRKQLHLYYIGLKENPEFKDKNIKLYYYLLENEELINVPLKISYCDELEKEMDEISEKIKFNKEFNKCSDKLQCLDCLMSELCNENLE